MIIDTLENSSLYVALHPRFKSAFEFLKRPGIESLPIGRVGLDGDLLYALTQEYETKPVHEGKLEAHKRYIDIQFVLAGEEVMGYAPLGQLTSAQPFDTAKDFGLYNGTASLNLVRKGMFAVFFPQDGHLPGRCNGQPAHVKKIVLKIAV